MVGKTSVIARFVQNKFGDKYLKTIGTNVSSKEVKITIPGKNLTINYIYQVWDIMGQPQYRDLMSNYYFLGCKGLLLVFDLTRIETFLALDEYSKLLYSRRSE